MHPPANNLFTATQIARAADLTRQAVYVGLELIPSAGALNSQGKDVAGWRFADLPMDWQLEITRRGVKRGFENGEAFLANLPEPWECPLAWGQVPQHQKDKAELLQKALDRALALRADGLKGAELEQVGMDDYKAAFGYSLKDARHWRRLLHRTIERDAGEENWQRVDLYLDDRAFIAPRPKQEVLQREDDHKGLGVFISSPPLQDRLNPTASDREFIWRKVCQHFDELTVPLPDSPAGNRERRLFRASLLSYLSKVFPAGTLCASQASLGRRFDEKLKGGPESWKDRRDNSGPEKRKLCPTCRPLMIGATVDFDKNYRQAWRRLHLERKLCETCRTAWKYDVRTHKSYCPKSVIEDIRADVDTAWSLRKGPKYRRLISPYVRRDWSDTPPGMGTVMDDMTPDHATFGMVELPLAYGDDRFGKPFVGRLEALFSVDERTDYPLAFLVILGDPETPASPQRKASYNQIHQRLLLLRQHDNIGLPHRGGWLKLENGPWKNYMMDGEKLAHWRTLDVPVFESGLAELGIRIRRTTPGNPRSKIIERVFHAVQSRMRCHPGFLGNNERMDKREAVQDFLARVKRGKEDAANELLHVSDYIKLLSDEFMAFAEEPQNGDRLPGVSPREAFYNGIDGHPGYSAMPLQQCAASARFLLSTHEKEVRVGPQGIVYKLAGHTFPFWGTVLESYPDVGILARFNIEEPTLLSCRAPDGHTFTLKAHIQMANTETKEQLAQTARDRASWMRRGKVLYDKLPHPFRFTIAKDSAHSAEARKFGEHYNREVEAAIAENSAAERKQRKAEAIAAAAGVPREFAARHPERLLQAEAMRWEAQQLRAEEEP